ncbi:hypothetical protein EVAR_52589_1 [Eumeta japonica]|uniref:Reverse transcriptase domain-containing protein n=1 Tax=Eumeta variegata TaxID=151549 RepID=A0A4C1YKG9_EUMVA|nr:hypothetical protein EVAR_52589_1 [Eumeta japonica]
MRLKTRFRTYKSDFEKKWDVRQGCVASTWLFNLYMDKCLHYLKEYECGRRMDELSVKCLLYADDLVILKMNESVKKRRMKVNVGETNVMVFERGESSTECVILIESEKVEQRGEIVSRVKNNALLSAGGGRFGPALSGRAPRDASDRYRVCKGHSHCGRLQARISGPKLRRSFQS